MHVLAPLRPGSSWDPAATLATAGQRHSLASHAFRRLRSLTDMTRRRKERIKMKKKNVFMMYFSKWSAWLPAALLRKLNISMKSTKKSTSPDLCWARSSKKACNCDIDLAFTLPLPAAFRRGSFSQIQRKQLPQDAPLWALQYLLQEHSTWKKHQISWAISYQHSKKSSQISRRMNQIVTTCYNYSFECI